MLTGHANNSSSDKKYYQHTYLANNVATNNN